MAKRAWALPGIQDLSKEQERARLLPLAGCHLIVGGPGTGKSVLALLRTRRHHRSQESHDYVFLVYNKLLLAASRELVGGEVKAHSWKEWFKGIYRRMLSEPCPVRNGEAFNIDWQAVKAGIDAAPPKFEVPPTAFVIIDEGQDMPHSFYHELAQLGFENFYVVADQNQQITDEHSSLHDIGTVLGIAAEDWVELRENYRNCDAVARLAMAFCVPDPASPPVNVPIGRPCARTPVLVDYGPDCRWDFNELIRRIMKLADRDPAKLIGIVTWKNETRRRWLSALRQEPVELDHGRPRIVTYASGEEGGDLRFSAGGVFVINAKSAKGLEFETVFIADIDEYPCHLEDEVWMNDKRRLFYVMVSRAREQVILLRRGDRACPIEAILPKDEGILRRWR